MTRTTAIEATGKLTVGGGTPYELARGLAGKPRAVAARSLRGALAVSPADADMGALRLWHMLRRHRVGPETLRLANRLLACVPLLDRQITVDNAFEACVLARQVTLDQDDPRRFFRYATAAHAAGMIAFWDRFGRSLAVEHRGRDYAMQVGDRHVVFAVTGPQLGLHFDFFFVHEPGMWDWLAGLTADDVLLDVGANVGLYSVAAAALSGCRVVGLEPFPVNVEAFRANVAANGLGDRVRILPIAASARSGAGRLSHDEAVPGVAAQAFHATGEAAPAGKSEMAVDGAAIDDLVASGAIPFPTHVKIDVDGNEGSVIAGMQGTLADPRFDSLRMEIRWWEPGKRAVVDAVCRHGFRAAVADDRKNLLFRRGPAAVGR